MCLFMGTFTFAQPHIQIELINRTLSNGGLTYTFDIQATALSGYTGTNSDWLAMSVSYEVALTGSQAITSATGIVNGTNANSLALPTSFPGGCATCKFRLNLTRTTQQDLVIGVPVILGMGTVNFNESVSGATIVTPRTLTNPQGSFWANANSGSRPFNLQSPFALPIYLSSFSADKNGERSVKLNWETSSEKNSSHFDIERTVDGLSWETIGQVAAAGNSTDTRNYGYNDDNLPLGRSLNKIFYYRLRMVDLDNAYKYSDIRGVNFTQNDRGFVSVYPNPASNYINIDLSGLDFELNGTAKIYMYDMSGRLVRQKDIIGSGLEPMNVQDLAADIYNIVVIQGDQRYTHKVAITH